MNRIIPEQVEEAYKKTRLKPRQGYWINDRCACGLGVVYAKKTGARSFSAGLPGKIRRRFGLSLNYLEGFIVGFDGERDYSVDKEFKQGFEDGKAAWNRVKHLTSTN